MLIDLKLNHWHAFGFSYNINFASDFIQIVSLALSVTLISKMYEIGAGIVITKQGESSESLPKKKTRKKLDMICELNVCIHAAAA